MFERKYFQNVIFYFCIIFLFKLCFVTLNFEFQVYTILRYMYFIVYINFDPYVHYKRNACACTYIQRVCTLTEDGDMWARGCKTRM